MQIYCARKKNSRCINDATEVSFDNCDEKVSDEEAADEEVNA